MPTLIDYMLDADAKQAQQRLQNQQAQLEPIKNYISLQRLIQGNGNGSDNMQLIPTQNGFIGVNKKTGQTTPILDKNGKPVMAIPKSGINLAFGQNGALSGLQIGGTAINPTTVSSRSLKGAQTATLNPDGTVTARVSPTQATDTNTQKRQQAGAESETLNTFMHNAFSPYSYFGSGASLLADATSTDPNRREKAARYWAAWEMANENAANQARLSGATQVGENLIHDFRDRLYPVIPDEKWKNLMPREVLDRADELRQSTVLSGNQNAVDESMKNFPVDYDSVPWQNKNAKTIDNQKPANTQQQPAPDFSSLLASRGVK